MFMRSLKLGVLALFLGTIGFINTSFAADDPQQPCPMMQENMHNCAQYQKLTTDQKAKVDKIMQDFKGKIMPLKDQLWTKKEELDKQFMTPTPNEAAINSLVKEISGLHNQMFAAHIQARLEMTKIGFSSGECWESMHPMMGQSMENEKGMGMQHRMMHGSMPEAPTQGLQSGPTQGLQSSSSQGLSR